jgi:hypothetical protein
MDWTIGLKRESINRHSTEKQLDGILTDRIIRNQVKVDHLKKQKSETTAVSDSKIEKSRERSPKEILETLIIGFDKNSGKAIKLLRVLLATHPEAFDRTTSISILYKIFDGLSNLNQHEIIEAGNHIIAPIYSSKIRSEKIDSSDGIEAVS